jgi:cytochrome c554/c'-like protein
LRLLRISLIALCAIGLCAVRLVGAQFVGPNKCSSCHDHEKQKAWADQDKHAKALTQLEDKNAGKYAKAIGLADPYDLKGACVKCHATVFNGDANAGVSCEICHGAGSDYVEPHQQKGSYAKAITLGMFDTRGNYPVWAKMCLDCHIVRDARLTGAGHKSGADFEVGAASQKIVHWAPTYDFAKLTALGRGAAGKAAAAPPKAAPAAPPKAESAATPKAAPAATPKAAPAATPKAAPAAPQPTAAPSAAGKPTAPAKPTAAAKPTSAVPARGLEPTREAIPPTAASITPAPPTQAPAPEIRPSAPPAKTWTPATRDGITIQIQATPIPTTTPIAPPQAPESVQPAPLPPSAGAPPKPPPAVRARKPHPKHTAVATRPPAPQPTPSPTKLPAPQEPPRRPPH